MDRAVGVIESRIVEQVRPEGRKPVDDIGAARRIGIGGGEIRNGRAGEKAAGLGGRDGIVFELSQKDSFSPTE